MFTSKVLLLLGLISLLACSVSGAEPAAPSPAPTPAAGEPAKIEINDSKVIHEVWDDFHGINLCALWNDTSDHPETVKAFSQMGSKILRFPGGVPCQWYDWKEPLATGWTTLTPEKAHAMAAASGARMMFQTNTANDGGGKTKEGKEYKFNNSGEHAAGWVKFCQEKNIKVAVWEIGNEPEMDAPAAIKSDQNKVYEWYNAKYKEQVEAIKKADPNARVMGPASTNTWFWWAQNNLEKFMKAHGNKGGSGLADMISIHWYPEAGNQPWDKARGVAQGWAPCMDYIKGVLAKYDDRKLPLYITEWNFGGGDKHDYNKTLGNALGNADCIGMFLKTGVAGHTFFVLHRIKNGWGVIAQNGDVKPQNHVSPTFFALAMASKLGHKVVETKCALDAAHVLSTYATKDASGGVQVLLINKSDKPLPVALNFTGYKADGKEVDVYTLAGANGKIDDMDVVYNEVKAPKPNADLLPAPKKVKSAATYSHTLAPLSMAVLSFPGDSAMKE
ncbi:MAG TPA: glycoside hydrolase family 44 protein [Planctomycetota bacterium]|nr:glycoside hydrolase family 44 protein [Planctomycetota bacterium]